MSCFYGLPDEAAESIDLFAVRKRFAVPSRLAGSAFLRREVAARMHERLAGIRLDPRRLLDAGCGEGADWARLKGRFPGAEVVALDASEGMLQAGLADAGCVPASPVCADFAALPFLPGSFGMVWSNLALHWHSSPFQVFSAWKAVLDADGMLLFSCFGPGTLSPLREAFCQVDGYGHILPFMEMHDLGDALVDAGFPSPVLDREEMVVTYSSVKKCLSDVRAFGGNVLVNRPRALMGRQAYGQLMDALESGRDEEGLIRMPYEVIYGHAFCSVTQAEAGIERPVHFYPGR
ncbi:MAG: methyltransferase domain-containing protein [Alistipes senegalensis]|nr:methyltransferase domain-containing protein [Oxalobacter formigenes]MCM1280223.1 methyltransferase domain-containing protein [Alistipes senegalensis]